MVVEICVMFDKFFFVYVFLVFCVVSSCVELVL